MPKIKQTSLDELNKRLNPSNVLQSIGATKIKDFGDSVRAFCPIHGSDNQRSLAVMKDNNIAFCHNTACKLNQKAVNLIELYSIAKSISFPDAAKELAGGIGYKLQYEGVKKKEYKYVEVAYRDGEHFKRNVMIKKRELSNWREEHSDTDCYRSLAVYPKKDITEENAVISDFIIDFDNPVDPRWDNPEEHLQNTVFSDISTYEDGLRLVANQVKEVTEKLIDEYDIPEEAIIPAFTGTGMGLEVDHRVLGIEPSFEEEMMEKYKKLAYHLCEVDTKKEKVVLEWNPDNHTPAKKAYRAKYQTADQGIYNPRRLTRLANTVNTKSGKYKVHMDTMKFLENYSDIEAMLEYANTTHKIRSFPKKEYESRAAVDLLISLTQEEEAEEEKLRFPNSAFRGLFANWKQIYSHTTEAPDCFLYASLLTGIGALLGRRVYVVYGAGSKLYPNIYGVIIGETAKVKKTTAVNTFKGIYSRVDPNTLFSAGISTTQGLIELLRLPSEAEVSEYTENESLEDTPPQKIMIFSRLQETGRLSYEGMRLLYFEREFSKMLKKVEKEYSSDFIETITDAFDMPSELDNHSLSNPLRARNPSLSILSSTTQGKIQRRLKVEEIEGGFANRFMYFIGNRKPPLPMPPEPNDSMIGEFIIKLHEQIEKWDNQQFTLTEEAEEIWNDFYSELYYEEYGDILDDILGRIDVHTLKIALIYAALENEVPVITANQMKAAIDIGYYLKEAVIELFSSYGMSELAKDEEKILSVIKSSKSGITKTKINSEVGFSYSKIGRILSTLEREGIIKKIKQDFKDKAGRKQTKNVYKIKYV